MFYYLTEQRILDAYQRGEFDNLEGFGREVDNSDYFSVPEENRIAFHILKNAGLAPGEIELRKELNRLIGEIGDTTDAGAREKLKYKYAMLESRLNLLAEKK